MLEDILLILSVLVVMVVVGLAVRRLDRLLEVGRATPRREYRSPARVYDHREETLEQTGYRRRSCLGGLFRPFLLR